MHLISKFNKRICFLLCVTDIFSKYACVIPLKDKNIFKEILGVSSRKPNKMWTDKGSPFRSMKSWSQGNEGKSVVAERFIRTLKNKIQKYMTSISKMCILIN